MPWTMLRGMVWQWLDLFVQVQEIFAQSQLIKIRNYGHAMWLGLRVWDMYHESGKGGWATNKDESTRLEIVNIYHVVKIMFEKIHYRVCQNEFADTWGLARSRSIYKLSVWIPETRGSSSVRRGTCPNLVEPKVMFMCLWTCRVTCLRDINLHGQVLSGL
jgi:hypothetical protein